LNKDLSGIGMTSQRTRNRLIDRLRVQGIEDEKLLNVIGALPRHLFVDEALAHRAYEDTALPIGFNQTISRPYIVARMTELLLCQGPISSVLEIGTGSGYQASVLAKLIDRVYTVERISGMLERAVLKFEMLGLRNIQSYHSDGLTGLTQYGPFDGIILTASPTHIPEVLVEQLVVGGRMVLPLSSGDLQELVVVTRTNADFEVEVVERVNFVPLVSGKL
tara:strand:- start:868 stop:1527 length:660 start_codon:yes stop_codon:yes gene_type:complete